eukprot:TRINITY_DN30664_c0_g1_i1.p1 TRINITY_DN30664_c0_g1~~TRINITY_DN30664_c0_g1_i1.p1  ORF type:complete len:281 (+),score=52.01 TRINITY_DN30664_c0_g1_i1:74-916(+)
MVVPGNIMFSGILQPGAQNRSFESVSKESPSLNVGEKPVFYEPTVLQLKLDGACSLDEGAMHLKIRPFGDDQDSSGGLRGMQMDRQAAWARIRTPSPIMMHTDFWHDPELLTQSKATWDRQVSDQTDVQAHQEQPRGYYVPQAQWARPLVAPQGTALATAPPGAAARRVPQRPPGNWICVPCKLSPGQLRRDAGVGKDVKSSLPPLPGFAASPGSIGNHTPAAEDTQSPPSLGSIGHPHTCGDACKYFRLSKGCKDGASCDHCHVCIWHRYGRKKQKPTA